MKAVALTRPLTGGRAGGLLLCATIGLAAAFLHQFTRAPASFVALLIGAACRRHVASDLVDGYRLATGPLLRTGIALLGLTLPAAALAGMPTALIPIAVGGVVLTLLLGMAVGRLLGLPAPRAFVGAAAVAICGASAALAVSSVLHKSRETDQALVTTIAGVTLLSTGAMLVYPALAHLTGLSGPAAGIFLGTTIHDVAQVLAAASAISDAAPAAILTKLTRILCLVPAVWLAALAIRRRAERSSASPSIRPPLFILGFTCCSLLASSGWVADAISSGAQTISSFTVVMATAALGLQMSTSAIIAQGWRPFAMLVLTTIGLGLYGLLCTTLLLG